MDARYYVQPRLHHYSPDFVPPSYKVAQGSLSTQVRKPTVPTLNEDARLSLGSWGVGDRRPVRRSRMKAQDA